ILCYTTSCCCPALLIVSPSLALSHNTVVGVQLWRIDNQTFKRVGDAKRAAHANDRPGCCLDRSRDTYRAAIKNPCVAVVGTGRWIATAVIKALYQVR